jgi:Stress responsive A/B Barrel Domain
MIRHIVLFTAKEPAEIRCIEEGLALLATNPHARHLEVGRNLKADRSSTEVDVIVYGEFDDEDALTAYKAHPIWAEATRRVKPLREMRVVADWCAETALGRRELVKAAE